MAEVYWTDSARAAFDQLPASAKQEIDRRLALLRQFPEMYPRLQRGRFRGYRRFVVLDQYQVVYRVMGEARRCFIRAIRPARGELE
jgi:hypothetical protein